MNNSQIITKLINYTLLASLLIFVLSFGVYFYSLQKTPKGSLSEPFSRNMFLAHRVSDTEIWYHNGNTFVSINPKSQETKYLSAHHMIPGVTQAFWLKGGVVFATQEAGSFSDLQPTIDQILVNDPDSRIGAVPTYWYLSFKDSRIKALTTNVTQPENFGVIATDGTFIFKDSDYSYSVLKESGEIVYGVVDMEDTESRPIYGTADSLTYLTSSTSGNDSGKKKVAMRRVPFFKSDHETLSKDVFEDGVGTTYSQISAIDATQYVIARAKNDDKVGSDLYLYDVKLNKRTRIIRQFDGVVTKSSDGVLATKQGRSVNTIHSITTDGVVTRLRVDKNEHNYVTGALKHGGGFIVINSNGGAQLANKDKSATQSVKAAFGGQLEKEITDLPGGLSLDRNIESPYDTSYTLSFEGKSRDALNTLRTAISNKGYDPNQFIITLAPGRTAEF